MPNIDDIPYGYCQCGCGQKTKIAKKTTTKEGRIKGEPNRYLPHHGIRPMAVRFWKYVTPGPFHECWLWQGHVSSNGYGRISRDRTKQMIYAHRVSWEIHFGAIPDDLCVLHRCDVRLCQNPYHLFLGSLADNLDDMRAKGREARGAAVGGKVTPDQVVEIRALRAQGVIQKEVARRFGISQATVHRIEHRKVWKHVP